MNEEQKSQGWWHTVPGMLTAAAGVITAIAGLIVALHQAGVLSTPARSEPSDEIITREQLSASRPSAARTDASPATASAVNQVARQLRAPAAGTEVRLADLVYRILDARLEPRNMEQYTLRFNIRITNHGRYAATFWDDSFRLLVDDVPRAPVGGLNKAVNGDSAEEGEIEFVVPPTARSVILKVSQYGESTRIPVDLASAGQQ